MSVMEKKGIEEVASQIIQSGLSILATQGTADYLQKHGMKATNISTFTGFPEILGGRVKTLHPKLFGGLLGNPSFSQHREDLEKYQIPPIRLLLVNLYPFTQKSAHLSPEEALEWIDIGGAALIRSSLKNYQNILPLVDPKDWPLASQWKTLDISQRRSMALKAWKYLLDYDQKIYQYYLKEWENQEWSPLSLYKEKELVYGENPHQKASLWTQNQEKKEIFQEISGKNLSYNNYQDLYFGWSLLKDLHEPAAVVIKHTSPSGAAMAAEGSKSMEEVLEYAWQGDSRAAFGGVVLIKGEAHISLFKNGPLKGKFIDLLGANQFSPQLIEYLGKKRKSLKTVLLPSTWESHKSYRSLGSLFLCQEEDQEWGNQWKTVTQRPFPKEILPLAAFGVKVNRLLPSNSISIVSNQDGIYWQSGHGGGQPSRIGALENLALPLFMRNMKELSQKKKRDLQDLREEVLSTSVLVSDGFFPFPDSVERASQFGIQYIVQPGGSKKDGLVIEKADELGISMVFTGYRHFRH